MSGDHCVLSNPASDLSFPSNCLKLTALTRDWLSSLGVWKLLPATSSKFKKHWLQFVYQLGPCSIALNDSNMGKFSSYLVIYCVYHSIKCQKQGGLYYLERVISAFSISEAIALHFLLIGNHFWHKRVLSFCRPNQKFATLWLPWQKANRIFPLDLGLMQKKMPSDKQNSMIPITFSHQWSYVATPLSHDIIMIKLPSSP